MGAYFDGNSYIGTAEKQSFNAALILGKLD